MSDWYPPVVGHLRSDTTQSDSWTLYCIFSCSFSFYSMVLSSGSFTDPSAEGLSRERARERERSRPHERRHHSSAGEKQRYYSCERYGSREQCHTKSAGPSRSTSPGEGHDAGLLRQVSYLHTLQSAPYIMSLQYISHILLNLCSLLWISFSIFVYIYIFYVYVLWLWLNSGAYITTATIITLEIQVKATVWTFKE